MRTVQLSTSRTLTCARVVYALQYCLVERCADRRVMAARGTNRGEVAAPTEASASARCDVNTSAVTRQLPCKSPARLSSPERHGHRCAMMLMPDNPAATNTDTKRRVARQQHCVRTAGLSFSELPQPTLYRLYLFEVTRNCFISLRRSSLLLAQ